MVSIGLNRCAGPKRQRREESLPVEEKNEMKTS